LRSASLFQQGVAPTSWQLVAPTFSKINLKYIVFILFVNTYRRAKNC